jgi:glc operon protein GlcG
MISRDGPLRLCSKLRRMKQRPMIGHDEALAAIEAIRSELARRGKTAAIAVVDAHGELIAALRQDGSALSSMPLAINKAFTAARLRRPTRVLGEQLRSRGTDIVFYGDPRYVAFGGGVPVDANGTIVGGIGVSGLSDEDDEALALLGAAWALARG